jgi:hypothetical protein
MAAGGRRIFWVALALLQISSLSFAQPAPSPQDRAGAERGVSWDQGHDAKWHLDQHKKMANAIAAVRPHRAGLVDAYVLAVGLDADPVFTREASEASKVLTRRYDAAGRGLLLATGSATHASGSPTNIALGLAALAQQMDKAEDVLILFATAHGAPGVGVVHKESDKAYGMMAPQRLAMLLDELGIKRRLIIISACFSGQFVGSLATSDTIVITAADDDRTSFGCAPGNDWTFFGDALINNAMRQGKGLDEAVAEAFALINEWEFARGLTSSKPRLFIGDGARSWLTKLEARSPKGSTPKVGRPAIEDEPAPPTKP